MNILITGANGFIGKNTRVRLGENPDNRILVFNNGDSDADLQQKISQSDVVIHLAGVNRPENPEEFSTVNTGLTRKLCTLLKANEKPLPVLFSSSIQAENDNPYGHSKHQAELELETYSKETAAPVTVFRLPNVFGKWCRPQYNSVVATFCHNIANDLSIDIHDPDTVIDLVYVDDVVDAFIEVIGGTSPGFNYRDVSPVHRISLGELANTLHSFRESRQTLTVDNVGSGFLRALYATYLSYYSPDDFCYPLTSHEDHRGSFVEFLKTASAGQFSYFTALPGINRGGHYHHTKNEKFLVVQGQAAFRFRHIITGDVRSLAVTADEPIVVETIPGWAHDITNTGESVLVVLLWANEVFDRSKPDTIGASLDD